MCYGRLTVVLVEIGTHGGNSGFRPGAVVNKGAERVRRHLLMVGATSFVDTSACDRCTFR